MKQVIQLATGVAMMGTIGCGDPPTSAFTHAETEDGAVAFTNNSLNAEIYHWDFGDGTTGVEKAPVHRYPLNGTYQVRLTASRGDEQAVSTMPVTVTRVQEGTYYFWTTSTEKVPIDVFVDGVSKGRIMGSESNCQYGRGYEVVVRAAAGVHRVSASMPGGGSWKETNVPISPGEQRCLGFW